MVFHWLGTLSRIVALFVREEAGDMIQLLASRADNIWGSNIGGWGRTGVVSSPLVFTVSSCQYFE